MDLALNNLHGLICHKNHQTKPNQSYFQMCIYVREKQNIQIIFFITQRMFYPKYMLE